MEFEPFPKIPRLNRDITITEKLDGTNAAVLIDSLGDSGDWIGADDCGDTIVHLGGSAYQVGAQSRNRLVFPNSEENKQADNHGFAGWVRDNAAELVRLLGPGRHFGEWWGLGIARNYGLDHKRFSLFNPDRYAHLPAADSNLDVWVVPVLHRGPFHTDMVKDVLRTLASRGSFAAPGFMKPEGVIVYHTAARQSFKVTIEKDEAPKGSIHWGDDKL